MKNYWNRLNKKSLLRRMPFVLLSIPISIFGVSCYYACGLGADPISVFVDGQHVALNLSYGQVTTINNVVLVVLALIFARRYVHIGTLLTCFLNGPLIDFFEGILSRTFPADTAPLWIRIAMLAVGAVMMGFGTGMFVTVNTGVGPFDFIPLMIRDKTGLNLRWARMILDALYVVAGWLMGGVVGVGTITGVLLTGPLMSLFMRWFQQPMDNYFGPLIQEES